MAALSATPAPTLKDKPRGRGSYIVTNAATVYPTGGVGVTSAGRLSPWSDTADLLWKGVCLGGTTRNTSANAGGKVLGDTSASPPYEADVDENGKCLVAVAVAGASAQTDIDRLVFCSTDNIAADLSLTATVNVGPIGRITRFRSSTSFDVELFTPAEYLANDSKFSVLSIPITLVAITGAGDVVTGYVPGFAGRVMTVQWETAVAVTTAAKLASLNLEIQGVNVTGGVVALTSANCTPLGARVAGSAVTAANHFTATDTLEVEAASVTAFAEGSGVLLVLVKAD